ncbi:DUF58 domain-containing protein [Rubrimonas cliftonensis]|uniref:DUF58 domain-containing protein n=1 Tax=Rubrimonas cliftonensis TaxID=89524 RepID=A0A1H4E491_9RHOB|nr:DUF58 domain-containing protein [Rubrimonas cliftonensis]SEA79657.1 Protein of unknown function DUF58 [Rubrimonas cliftonensis]
MTAVDAAALAAPGVAVTLDALRALRLAVRRTPARPAAGAPGSVVSRSRGRGMEPRDVRPFVDGDDPRALDRHVTARTGRPHVRDFHDERAHALLLIADFRPAMLWGTRGRLRSVAAAEALAAAGWRAAEAGGRVGLLAVAAGGVVRSAMRPGALGMEAAAGALVSAHARALEAGAAAGDGAAAMAEALEEAARAAPTGADAALASSLEELGAERGRIAAALEALGRRARLATLLATDPFETDPPPGVYPVADAVGAAFWARILGGAAAASGLAARRALAERAGGAALLDASADLAGVLAALDAAGRRRRRPSGG